jgi:tetratricopeptide (TPR) repeat protein
MSGQSAVAIEAARKVAANVRLEQIEAFPSVEFFKTIPLLALTQFGRWDEILAESAPPENLHYSTAIWHYARGVALANRGEIAAARDELAALWPLRDSVQMEFLDAAAYPASALLSIAADLLNGEIALASDANAQAVEHFAAAVATQDALPYTEPPFWYYPTRQSLGLAELRAGDAAEAEHTYRRDLEDYPRNGWSTFGLVQSLHAQGRDADATAMQDRFDTIWSMADIELNASRL